MKRFALLFLLLGCSPSPTAPRSLPPRALRLTVLSELPVPVPISVERIASTADYDTYRLTFTDVATDETLVGVVWNGGSGYPTNGIGGTTGTGVRSVDLYGSAGATSVQLNYRFADTSYGTTCGCVFGPFSEAVAITDAVVITVTKRKGRK